MPVESSGSSIGIVLKALCASSEASPRCAALAENKKSPAEAGLWIKLTGA
jgi:hypothetical protein